MGLTIFFSISATLILLAIHDWRCSAAREQGREEALREARETVRRAAEGLRVHREGGSPGLSVANRLHWEDQLAGHAPLDGWSRH